MEECKHENGKPSWDYYQCTDCGWIKPSGQCRGIHNGWFPSMEAVKEYDKFGAYQHMSDAIPMKR